ncbi:MAG: DUF3089 domain-containing protein [Steroidobacteraceae bacterium]
MRIGAVLGVLGCAASLWPTPGRSQPPVDYAAPASWLCWPGHADACSAPVITTVISSQGGGISKQTYVPDPAAPLDCFYVYPTVSTEAAPNADMTSGPEEQHAATAQFARFGAKCRTFAPLYRQTTLAGLTGTAPGADSQLPYRDVLAAWHYYLAHENRGRGVVLVGHSQGSFLLGRLIAEQIDGKPIQRQLVSAILAGGDIQVPVGRDVGGTFQHVPLCRKADQIGCVIGYSSYLASNPPGPDAIFGKAAGPGSTDACVNPAALTGDGVLNSELPTRGDVTKLLGTSFVENPGLLSAECSTVGDRAFLSVSVKMTGLGAEGVNRALTALDGARPGWGLHALDISLSLGNLVEIVGREGQTWAAANH